MDPDEPQKPKLSTAAKQMGGLSSSTRSKVKRTSYSDTDSSGSESHEPALKRQTRQDGKLADKSVGINNDATPDADPIDTNTVDEPTSAEIALRNELVLESLFSYMNRSDLLSCRLVNKKWQYEATNELRRRKLIIKFTFHCQKTRYRDNTVFQDQDPCRVIRECRTLSLLSSFQMETSFLDDPSPYGFRSIFTALGNRMKNLKLRLNCLIRRCSFKRSSLITDLRNLFFRQTTNLEFLEIKFDMPEKWMNELQTLDSSDPPRNDNNELLLLPNLKTFIVKGTPPPRFVTDVINAAINLKSAGGVFSCDSSALIKYFMGDERRDKICLLKYLRIHLVMGKELDTDLLERFLAEHKTNLKLETFECVSLNLVGPNVSTAPRIVNAINQLLECSSESIQKLRIEPKKWFLNLLVIPRLPKLQEICFDCFWRSRVGPQDEEDFFPRGTSMNFNFPNVSSIVFLRCTATLFRRFVHSIEMNEPVPSVRHIIMIDGKARSVPLLASDFRHVFPKLVSISYCVEHYFYEI